MQPLWLVLALLLAVASSTQAATFRCGVSWRADGRLIRRFAASPRSCQQECEKRGCNYFYLTEDANKPRTMYCNVMGQVWNGFKGADWGVIHICARDWIWGQLGVPAVHTSNRGTFIPSKTSGAYSRAAASTGVVGIHATMIPNTDNMVFFGRPQDPDYPPQPGMAIGGTGAHWPSSILNVRNGKYYPVQWNMGAPFCAHQVHTVNGDILVCGGDEDFVNLPGNGNWGGTKGCRYMTKVNGQMVWYKFGDMSGGHWYPSMIELPPGVSGSRGTCALVIGGLVKASTPDAYILTEAVDIACLQMGLVFGHSVYTAAKGQVAESLRQVYPVSYLLPVGDAPAPPQIVLFGEKAGDVVTLNVDFKGYQLRFNSIKYIPPVPEAMFTFNAPSTSVLKAIDMNRPIDKNHIEVIIFGGQYIPGGPFRAADKVWRVKPLADKPTWGVEKMPSPSVMREAINLPNGKVLLINGAQLGQAGGGRLCCSSKGGAPILQVWIYNPAAPAGKRFYVEPLMQPHFRLYHNTAWLGRDGHIYIAGGDQAVIPNNRPDFTMDRYALGSIRTALARKVRPYIARAPARFRYGNRLTVTIKGGYASRCSLSKPVATTHASASSHRMIILKTVANRMDKKNVRRGGTLTVATPKSSYTAPPGWWLLYCWNGDVWTGGNWIYLQQK